MNIFSHKRAEAITIVLIIIIIAVFLGWLINFTSKECRSNSQCQKDNYCGSDFACHQIPVIEKTVVSNNLVMPSIIIGIAIVIAALILKNGKLNFRKSHKQKTSYEETYKNPLKAP